VMETISAVTTQSVNAIMVSLISINRDIVRKWSIELTKKDLITIVITDDKKLIIRTFVDVSR